MPYRYAPLLEIRNGSGRPVGVAIEHADGVAVDLPSSYGIPAAHSGEYRVLQPDLAEIIYRPGDAGYLEQVLVDLSWGFAIGEIGVIDELTPSAYARLRANLAADYARRQSGAYAETSIADYVIAGSGVYWAGEMEETDTLTVNGVAVDAHDLARAA